MEKVEWGFTAFEFLEEGQIRRYILAICEDSLWGKLAYMYVSEDGQILDPFGNLKSIAIGYKVEDPSRYKVVSTNITEFPAIVDAENLRIQEKEAARRKELSERATRINELPESFESPIPGFEFVRTPAVYNPKYAPVVWGGDILVKAPLPYVAPTTLHPYVREDGALLVKKFTKDFGDLIPEGTTPREVLSYLLERRKELTEMVKSVM